MAYVFVGSFILGLLLGVRLMFFGAERRRIHAAEVTPLRRSEPATIAFLVVFGATGYVLIDHSTRTLVRDSLIAAAVAVAWAAIVTRLAIATARIRPAHDQDDPRFALQGRVGIVVVAIPAGGEGTICFEDAGETRNVRARDVGGDPIPIGEDVCIERVDSGVASVERWALVEERL